MDEENRNITEVRNRRIQKKFRVDKKENELIKKRMQEAAQSEQGKKGIHGRGWSSMS